MTPIKRLSALVILVLAGTAYTVEAYLNSFQPPGGPVVCAAAGCEPLLGEREWAQHWERARPWHSEKTRDRAEARGWRGSCPFAAETAAEG